MRIAIMQPTYLPWMGYFDIMDQVELFVFLDNVQFVKQSWHVRNRIKTPKGLEWLTVPVMLHGRFGQLMNEAEIRKADFWKKHTRTIEVNYGRAPYFQDYFYGLLSVFEQGNPWIHLVDLNIKLIEWLSEVLGVKNRSVHSSHLEVAGRRSSLIAAICRSLGATEYLSPIGSAAYLLGEIQEFTNRGIEVFFHNYKHPTYNQLFPPFLPFASVIDLIFNEGPRSMGIIRSGRGHAFLPGEVSEKETERGEK
jgi:hypothetical protein